MLNIIWINIFNSEVQKLVCVVHFIINPGPPHSLVSSWLHGMLYCFVLLPSSEQKMGYRSIRHRLDSPHVRSNSSCSAPPLVLGRSTQL